MATAAEKSRPFLTCVCTLWLQDRRPLVASQMKGLILDLFRRARSVRSDRRCGYDIFDTRDHDGSSDFHLFYNCAPRSGES